MRILYAYFLRKRSLHYIYSSKIENKASHAKYRQKLLDSLEDPTGFNSFKWITAKYWFLQAYFWTGHASLIIGRNAPIFEELMVTCKIVDRIISVIGMRIYLKIYQKTITILHYLT